MLARDVGALDCGFRALLGISIKEVVRYAHLAVVMNQMPSSPLLTSRGWWRDGIH
jgi:hypothetical protein